MFDSDFQEYILDYRTKSQNDSHYIYRYIAENRRFSVFDLAAITGADPKRIRRIMHDFGYVLSNRRGKTTQRKQDIPANLPDLEHPINWRDPDWLNRATLIMGARKIARLINVSYQRVTYVINKLGLSKNAEKRNILRHQFKNHSWLHHHYHILHYDINKCARLANVSKRTMKDWFSQLGISSRKRALKLPQRVIWFEECLENLRRSKLFKYVVIYDYKIRLTLNNNEVIQLIFDDTKDFKFGIRDILLTRTIFDESKIPKILPMYTSETFSESKRFEPHMGCQRLKFDEAGIIEQQVYLINLAGHIHSKKIPFTTFPKFVLESEKIRLENMRLNVGNDCLMATLPYLDNGDHPINKISIHFSKPRFINYFARDYKYVLKLVLKMKNLKNIDMDYCGFLMSYMHFGPNIFGYDNITKPPFCPILTANYLTLEKRTAGLIDVLPSVSMLIAHHYAGRTYNFINNKNFNLAISGDDSLLRLFKTNISTHLERKEDRPVYNLPYGYMSNNLKFKIVTRQELKSYCDIYEVTRAEPIGYANNVVTSKHLMISYV